jgi:hypothetical protein
MMHTDGNHRAIEILRDHAILSARAGFAFLLVMSFVWLAAALLTYFVPKSLAPWLFPLLGGICTPLAIVLDKRLRYIAPEKPDVLLPLTLQLLFVQIVAFPSILMLWDKNPDYVPAAFASIVGAHFLPFQWVYRTRMYLYLGLAVSIGSLLIVWLFRAQALHIVGFYVGTCLLVGALIALIHAASVWDSYQRGWQVSRNRAEP